tara:strand:- start:1875 stop:2192 length:318 start_codon:yes stop_codon:yes gene_type:complete
MGIENKYFEYWNEHNVVKLKDLFKDDIQLIDWDNKFIGIDEVINENVNIFTNFPNIKAEIIDIGNCDNKVFVEIKVLLNNEESIDVIDVIEIEDGLIKKIKAYKC